MLKLKKSLNYFALLLTICIAGCNKDDLNYKNSKSIIGSAKSFFEEQMLNKNIVISSKNGERPLRFTPLWEKAQLETIDGQDVVTASAMSNMRSSLNNTEEIYLIIRNTALGFEMKSISILSDKKFNLSNSDLYSLAFKSNPELDITLGKSAIRILNERFVPQKLITSDGVKVNVTYVDKNLDKALYSKKIPPQIRKMYMAPPGENCIEIDWYLQTWEYDEYGDYLYFDEMYLYSTLECDGVGPGGSSGSIPLNVINDLVDSCKIAAFKDITSPKINNYITNTFRDLYVNNSTNRNILFKEAPNLTVKNTTVSAYSSINTSNNNWEISLSSNYFSGANYNISKEGWGIILIHEILHGIINELHPTLDWDNHHMYIFATLVNNSKDLLKESFGLNDYDATGLALSGIRDIWSYSNMDHYSLVNYNFTQTQVDNVFKKYTEDIVGGTKCKK